MSEKEVKKSVAKIDKKEPCADAIVIVDGFTGTVDTSAVAIDATSIPQKSAKQLEKEAKKAAKLQKLQEKLDKKAANPLTVKDKEKKLTKEIKESATYEASTNVGEKKDVSGQLPDSYSPKYVEAAWYSWWEKEGFFKPEYKTTLNNDCALGTFTIIIPPPNVTGHLHLGHALTNSIQDAIVRYNRMIGKKTLWVPGCDHAGIATQVVVEKKLWREKKMTRHDLGREKFVEEIWKWRNEKGGHIYDQLKSIGSSFDWDRVSFTMDPMLCEAVTAAFIQLHKKDLIYRSSRLVNWSCALKSAISDIEVDKVEISERTFFSIPGYEDKVEFGVIISFAYKIENSNDEIIVATTRIETMLGDTAIAVHPSDERYKHLHGKFALHPFSDRKLPIVCDEFVDVAFGTGAVKITPAHDPNDYDIGKRHNLPFITIFNDEGEIIGDYGEFTGMKRFECRKAILNVLKNNGLYRDTKPNPMVVPFCSRSKDVVEPIIKPQWYVRCDKMAKKASDVVLSGDLKIIPETHEKTWNHWLNGIRDWCISRQLWWGHRIPAYYVTLLDGAEANTKDDEDLWIVAGNAKDALTQAAKRFNVAEEKISLKQDEDVLDTWFSSALFPFSVFGWPNRTKDLAEFYPTSLLETGHDILFFWVARMVFFGQELLDELPFKEILLHPMIRDAHGRKMSKSLGNVIDPMDVINGITLEELNKQLLDSNLDPKEIEKAIAGQKRDYPNGIPECGTDALRFGLCSYNTQGRDINLDILRIQGYRFFCNKIWNATKFALLYFAGDNKYTASNSLHGDESNIDLWILSRLAEAIELAHKGFTTYDLSKATSALYNFWLYDLCDIYLECLKPVFQCGNEQKKEAARRTLFTCLYDGLQLISPFMPFITEELFQHLPRADDISSICVTRYPGNKEMIAWHNETIKADFGFVDKAAKSIRSVRSEYGILNKQKLDLYITSSCEEQKGILNRFCHELQTLAHCSKIEFVSKPPSGCAILTLSNDVQMHLMLKGFVDIEKELSKLQKRKGQLEQLIEKINQAVSAPDYSTKVPIAVQDNNKDKLLESKNEVIKIIDTVDSLTFMLNCTD